MPSKEEETRSENECDDCLRSAGGVFAWSVVSFAGFGGGFGGANECSVVIVV